MAKPAKHVDIEQAEEATDLAVMAQVNPLAIFTDEAKFSEFYQRLKAETDKHVPDISTAKGRDAIRSLARRVVKAKTTLKKAGLDLTEEWRRQTALVTASRKKMEDELAELAAEVRRPLTEWEEKEKARVAACEATIQRMREAAVVTLEDTSETVRQRGAEVWEIQIDDAEFSDLADEAKTVKSQTVATLHSARERLIKEEEDRAELERLRAQDAARQEKERHEREARELAPRAVDLQARADAKAEKVGADIIANLLGQAGLPIELSALTEKAAAPLWTEHLRALADREREEEEKRQREIREAEERAAEQAREKAAREAKEAEEARQREHERALAEERRQAQEAKAAARARQLMHHISECGRGLIGGQPQPYGMLIAELEEKVVVDETLGAWEGEVRVLRTRVLAELRESMQRENEQAAREADRTHRRKIQKEAKEAIMTCGADEETARKIVLAIVANEIPNVNIRF